MKPGDLFVTDRLSTPPDPVFSCYRLYLFIAYEPPWFMIILVRPPFGFLHYESRRARAVTTVSDERCLVRFFQEKYISFLVFPLVSQSSSQLRCFLDIIHWPLGCMSSRIKVAVTVSVAASGQNVM